MNVVHLTLGAMLQLNETGANGEYLFGHNPDNQPRIIGKSMNMSAGETDQRAKLLAKCTKMPFNIVVPTKVY